MGYIEGLMGGFADRKAQIEAQNLEEARRSQDREGRILSTLIESPDPEVRSLAMTGLLHSALPGKRKGGFAGWLGEMESSPYLPQIAALVNQPVTTTETTPGEPTLPSSQTSGYISTPPDTTGSAALPGTSSVNVGSPPPRTVETNLQVTESPSQPTAVTRSVTRPREVFPTTEGTMLRNKRAAAQGDVEGQVAGLVASGFNEQEARDIVKRRMMRLGAGATGYQSIAGTFTDEDGNTVQTGAAFDRASGQYLGTDPNSPYYGIPIPGFVPRQGAAANYRYGQDRESIALAKYGKPFGQLSSPEAQDVMEEEKKVIAGKAQSRTEGAGAGKMNVPIDVPTAGRTGAVVGTTSAQYSGQRVGTAQERDRKIGVENVKAQLGRVKDLLAPLPSEKELAGLAPGAALAARRRLPQYRNSIAQMEAGIDNIVNALARSVGEQRGTQTEKDAERAYNTVVQLKGSLLDPLRGDTQESARARIDETLKYLDQVLSTLPGAPQPGPPPAGTVGAPPPGPAGPPAPTAAAASAPSSSVGAPPPGPAGPATTGPTGPDLSGLAPNQQRRFTKGPFAGQVWILDATGQPKRVQ